MHANHRGKEEERRRRKSGQVTLALSLGQGGWILLRAPWGSLKGYKQEAAQSDIFKSSVRLLRREEAAGG